MVLLGEAEVDLHCTITIRLDGFWGRRFWPSSTLKAGKYFVGGLITPAHIQYASLKDLGKLLALAYFLIVTA